MHGLVRYARRRMVKLASFALVALMQTAPTAAGPRKVDCKKPDASLKAAIDAYNNGELERAVEASRCAIEKLKNAIQLGETASIRARARLYLGLSQAALGRLHDARVSFSAAILDDPTIRLTKLDPPPEIRGLFDDIRRHMKGELLILSSEAGAHVFVDGKKTGEVPTTLKLPPGNYKIRVMSRDGARRFTAEVLLRYKQKETITAVLRAAVGTLVLEKPSVTFEVLDGDRPIGALGPGKAPLSIRAGLHRLVFRAKGRPAIRQDVTIAPEATTTIRLMETTAPILESPWYKKRRTWGWISLGVAAAIATTGILVSRSGQSAADQINEELRRGTLTGERYQALSQDAQAGARNANILFGISGAAAVTSLVLVLIGDRQRDRRAGIRIVPAPTGIALAATF